MTSRVDITSERATEIQRKLIALGYELPRYGADGVISEHGETWKALESFTADHVPIDLGDDGLSTGAEFEAAVSGLLVMPTEQPPHLLGDHHVEVLDISDTHQQKHIHGMRSWKSVDAIVLHQTAYLMDSVAAWRTLRAHVGVPRDMNAFYVVNPLNGLMWHANSFNGRSVGIEVSGNFCGMKGNRRTWWRPQTGFSEHRHGPHELSEQQAEATRMAIRHICDEVARHGGAITHIFAHRQASKDRISDPGEEIWGQCGEWARRELGLSSGPSGYHVGSGYPLPAAWGVDGGSEYWTSHG